MCGVWENGACDDKGKRNMSLCKAGGESWGA
jgi:hypothetical protein